MGLRVACAGPLAQGFLSFHRAADGQGTLRLKPGHRFRRPASKRSKARLLRSTSVACYASPQDVAVCRCNVRCAWSTPKPQHGNAGFAAVSTSHEWDAVHVTVPLLRMMRRLRRCAEDPLEGSLSVQMPHLHLRHLPGMHGMQGGAADILARAETAPVMKSRYSVTAVTLQSDSTAAACDATMQADLVKLPMTHELLLTGHFPFECQRSCRSTGPLG